MSFCKNYSYFSSFYHKKRTPNWRTQLVKNAKIMMRMNNENVQMFVCKHQSCQLNFIMANTICWLAGIFFLLLFYLPFHSVFQCLKKLFFCKSWHFLFIFSAKFAVMMFTFIIIIASFVKVNKPRRRRRKISVEFGASGIQNTQMLDTQIKELFDYLQGL